MLDYLRDDRFLDDGHKAVHGFFGRRGGVSTGIYGSLNCGLGSGDSLANVRHNRAAVAMAMGVSPGNLVTAHQIHSAECIVVDRPFDEAVRPQVDAMVTDRPGLALGILTADCGPVLFYGEKQDGAPVIGAAHAGWGGAFKGVLESTVKTMTAKGAISDTIRASIGPCIGRASYEVGQDFIDRFTAADPANDHFFRESRNAGHAMFDLPGYIAARLAGAGVRQVSLTDIDTYVNEGAYFSYRRTTHRGETDYGRQVSVIAIYDGR